MSFVFVLNKAAIFFAVLCVGYGAKLADSLEGLVPNKSCSFRVTEGQTAEITFSIRHESLLHEDFFAHLRRNRTTRTHKSTPDIVICDRDSPVKCTVVNERYRAGQIVNDSLTLQIPNVTRDFADTYVLQVYANGVPEPRYDCKLTVIEKPDDHQCLDSEVIAGETAELKFFVRQDVVSHQSFFALLRRDKYPMSDVVLCGRNSPVKCEAYSSGFMPSDIVNGRLTIVIPNVTKEFEDTYVFQAYAGRIAEPPDYCVLHVKVLSSDTTNVTAVTIMAAIVSCLVVVAVFVIVIVLWKRRKRSKELNTSLNGELNAAAPMLFSDQPDANPVDLKNKRWYFERTSHTFEAKLSKFWRNGKGSFLIAKDHGDFFTLTVCDDKEKIRRPRIAKTKSGYTLSGTDNTFTSLDALVAYNKEHDIVIGKDNFGKLVKPFEVEPKEVWYAGRKAREDAERLFTSKGKTPGSFLIRDNNTFRDCYTLAVNVGGEMKTFRISLDDDSFILDDAKGKKHFRSLAELVHYYQEHTMDTEKGNVGKLGRPVDARSAACSCF